MWQGWIRSIFRLWRYDYSSRRWCQELQRRLILSYLVTCTLVYEHSGSSPSCEGADYCRLKVGDKTVIVCITPLTPISVNSKAWWLCKTIKTNRVFYLLRISPTYFPNFDAQRSAVPPWRTRSCCLTIFDASLELGNSQIQNYITIHNHQITPKRVFATP